MSSKDTDQYFPLPGINQQPPGFLLDVELMQNLDIQVGRMMGLLKDPRYQKLTDDYSLDIVQCMLWMDITQILSNILDQNGYEDLRLPTEVLGLEAKKILAASDHSLAYIKALLQQYDILHENEEVGRVICETVDDIRNTYKLVEKELSKILSSQEDIQRWIEKKEKS